MNIFITEDERLIAEDLKFTLQNGGFNVVGIASSGEEALKQCFCCRPDLVLMDIILDGEIDGIETARRLNENLNIPVIYMSANNDAKTMREVNDTDNHGFISKPFKENQLFELIFKVKTTIKMA